jgi:hypothetical protein
VSDESVAGTAGDAVDDARLEPLTCDGEVMLVDCLDLDAVGRVRTYGTFGLNQP